ncbi:MAG: hypothetical protein HRU06_06720 [Oceanospirillaceae bacterium]|nr:hypothetical protein [Oceanospirillaceae bacterium]
MNKTTKVVTISLLASVSLMALGVPKHADHMMTTAQSVTLQPTEAGNDAFGTIQEIINILQRDPSVDWRRVNLEALRVHLIEMQDMTLNVEVIKQKPIKNGFVAVIKATSRRAEFSLTKVLAVHPKMLAIENGYNMAVASENNQFKITVTATNEQDIIKLQGLGYIGVMALGNHHQMHHLAIAKGQQSHQELIPRPLRQDLIE